MAAAAVLPGADAGSGPVRRGGADPGCDRVQLRSHPLLSPFCYYLYVKTDNPDPTSFRLVDRDSIYFTEDSSGGILIHQEGGTVTYPADPGIYYADLDIHPDVLYEDESIARVAGGYLFTATNSYSDGGELVLMQKTQSGSFFALDQFVETPVTVDCPKLQTAADYLVQTCAGTSGDLFTKLDAVQSYLQSWSVYPRSVYNTDDPNETWPYPFLAPSPYEELTLNKCYEMFHELPCGLLTSAAYPFIMDSLGFPGTIATVAQALEPECEVTFGTNHYEVCIRFSGESRIYGGAGSGGNTPLPSDQVEKVFSFQGNDDLGLCGTLEDYRELLRGHQVIADECAAQYQDLIAGTTFKQTIGATGGTWIKVGTEGSRGTTFSYVVPLDINMTVLSDAWVDGRYINSHEVFSLNDSFEDHPTADIVVQDLSYTDYYGDSHTQDVIFTYDEARDAWTAYRFYFDGAWYTGEEPLPDDMILTRKEVEEMDVDRNRNHLPESSLVYDGSQYPGTPITLTLVTGVSLPSSITLYVGQPQTICASVEPADAHHTSVTWTSSDPSIAEIDQYSGKITALLPGTVIFTATTRDGGYTASCTAFVLPAIEVRQFSDVPYGQWYSAPISWAVSAGITNGTDDTHFSPEDVCTRAQIVTFLWRSQGCPEPTSTENPFVDVVEGDHTSWYYKAVLWAVENGITNGRDATHFAPDQQCLRSEVVMFLWRTAQEPAATLSTNPFQDMTTDHWFYDPVMWAVGAGITNGVDDTHFGPDEECTRAQIVTFLYRYAA